jgi:hypothetical protein
MYIRHTTDLATHIPGHVPVPHVLGQIVISAADIPTPPHLGWLLQVLDSQLHTAAIVRPVYRCDDHNRFRIR